MIPSMPPPPSRVHCPPNAVVSWERTDTVLVDMDGTLLDLAFDNYFWLELVPAHYARARGLSEQAAREEMLARYQAIEGSLDWYCIDHWSEVLTLDIRALKRAHQHRVRYLPMAADFLVRLRERGKRVLLATNAHPYTLAVKVAQTDLDLHVDGMFSSHRFDAPKETRRFWERFHAEEGFDPERTLFIDDSLSVLEAADAFGLAAVVAIRCPDSRRPPREIGGFPSVDGVHDLLAGMPGQ